MFTHLFVFFFSLQPNKIKNLFYSSIILTYFVQGKYKKPEHEQETERKRRVMMNY